MPTIVEKVGEHVLISRQFLDGFILTVKEALELAKMIERVAHDPPEANREVAICGPAPSDTVSITNP